MSKIDELLETIDYIKKVEKINQLDYYEIAINILYTGTKHQKKHIDYFMRNYTGDVRKSEIKRFIDTEVILGKIEV